MNSAIVFIVVFFVAGINCESLRLNTSKSEVISCMSDCLNKNSTETLSDCYAKCKDWSEQILKEIPHYSIGSIHLLCRDSDSITIEMIDDYKNSTNNTGILYLIQVRPFNGEEIILVSNTSIVTISNLKPNTEYDVQAKIFNGKAEYLRLPEVEKFQTLESDNYIPLPILNETITMKFQFKNDSNFPFAIIRWKSVDLVCNYLFGLFSLSSQHSFNPHKEMNRARILKDPHDIYAYRTMELDYSTDYQLLLAGINTKNRHIEGPSTKLEFRVPSCYFFHGLNYEKCVPLPPKNITTQHEHEGKESHYNINVKWLKPEHNPDRYNVALYFKSSPPVRQIIAGTEHHALFNDVKIFDSSYDIHIDAISKAGHTTVYAHDVQLTNVHIKHVNQSIIHGFIIAISFITLIGVLITICLMRSNKKSIKSVKEIELRELAQSYHKDVMEVKPSNIQIEEILGEGAFGIVKRGILKPSNMIVAVKMLKKTAGTANVEEFFREIALMKSVQHVNIVGIIGHCTTNYDDMMLLTEYCSEGNLLDYLRYYRENGAMKLHPIETSASKRVFNAKCLQEYEYQGEQGSELNCFSNKLYDEENILPYQNNDNDVIINIKAGPSSVVDGALFVENLGYDIMNVSDGYMTPLPDDTNKIHHSSLSSKDLLSIAKQITIGMSHLSGQKIIHRDLAARNILVCADKTVKIADFGLSRDIYVDNIYMRSTPGRLPVKWLAIESMTKQEYTTKSDVWSFGILLYEIMTLGCSPYPGISTDGLLNYLNSGKRLNKPEICSNEFYQLMLSCWQIKPDDRLTFAELTMEIIDFMNSQDSEAFSIEVDAKKLNDSNAYINLF